VKTICDGAMKQAIINPITEMSDTKLVEKSIMNANRTFFDRIYVRTYEPDVIKRFKQGEVPSYLQNHLGTTPY
jgi:hypothetical protein